MSTHPSEERRQIHYVDHVLQKWLLIALVLLESALTAAAIWGLYRELSDIVDSNLYRVHFSEDEDLLTPFFVQGLKILIGTGIVNFIAIIVADRIWAQYVRGILRGLDSVTQAAQRLDLLPRKGVRRTHAVLDQALRWQRAESLRLKRIRYSVRHLPDGLPQTEAERATASAHLAIVKDRGSRAFGE
jgi:hypothetical protein